MWDLPLHTSLLHVHFFPKKLQHIFCLPLASLLLSYFLPSFVRVHVLLSSSFFKNTLQQCLCPQQGLSKSLWVPSCSCQGILTHSACKEWNAGRHKASDTSIPVKKALVQGSYLQRLLWKQSLHSQHLQLCGCYRCSYPAESRSPHWRWDKRGSPSQSPFKVNKRRGCFQTTEFTLELSSHQELLLFLSALKRKSK